MLLGEPGKLVRLKADPVAPAKAEEGLPGIFSTPRAGLGVAAVERLIASYSKPRSMLDPPTQAASKKGRRIAGIRAMAKM